MKAATTMVLKRYDGLLFQSTPPVKAATVDGLYTGEYTIISIHAAREGGDRMPENGLAAMQISIHAAREGGDNAANP